MSGPARSAAGRRGRTPLERIRRHVADFVGDSAGTALAETALVLPILITMGFVSWDFSNVFYQHQVVTTGVRDAARYLARAPVTSTSTVPCDATNLAALSTNAKNLAVYGDTSTGTARVTNWTTSQVSVGSTAVSNPTNSSGQPTYRGPTPTLYLVTVTATYTYQQLGMLTAFGFTQPTVQVSHTERCLGG